MLSFFNGIIDFIGDFYDRLTGVDLKQELKQPSDPLSFPVTIQETLSEMEAGLNIVLSQLTAHGLNVEDVTKDFDVALDTLFAKSAQDGAKGEILSLVEAAVRAAVKQLQVSTPAPLLTQSADVETGVIPVASTSAPFEAKSDFQPSQSDNASLEKLEPALTPVLEVEPVSEPHIPELAADPIESTTKATSSTATAISAEEHVES